MNNGIVKGVSKGTVTSTIVRKNDNLKEEMVKLIRESKNPLSTSDLANYLNKAWHTIDRACLMLQINGKIEGFRVGKMNLWRLK